MHIKEDVRVNLHGVGGIGAMGDKPFEHDHGFNCEVIVAVHKVTLKNVMMCLAFLQNLQKDRFEFKEVVLMLVTYKFMYSSSRHRVTLVLIQSMLQATWQM